MRGLILIIAISAGLYTAGVLMPKWYKFAISSVEDDKIIKTDTLFYNDTVYVQQPATPTLNVTRFPASKSPDPITEPQRLACNKLCVGCRYEIPMIDKHAFRKGYQVSPFGYNSDIVDIIAIRDGWVLFQEVADDDNDNKLNGKSLGSSFAGGIYSEYDCKCENFKFLRRL